MFVALDVELDMEIAMDTVSLLVQIEQLKAENEKWEKAWHEAKNEKINDSLELSKWKTIDSAPKDTPLLLIANGVVQDVTYALCASEKQWYTVQDQELTDDDEFKPTHWQRLPKTINKPC